MKLTIHLANDNLVILPRVTSHVTGAVITDATITATLYNSTDQIADANFNHKPMTAIDGQPGGYSCTVTGITASIGEGYYVLFEGTTPDYSFRARQAASVSERWI